MSDGAQIDDFIEAYRSEKPICVFTGAGVSFTQDERYRAPGWKQLLREILLKLGDDSRRQEAEATFRALDAKCADLWDLATEVKACAQTDNQFQRALRTVVLKENESVDSDGRLKTRNLRGATTLNAIVAFCSQVREIQQHPCFEANPRIKCVLTANYDWFLEAGATTKHQSYMFKPMTRPGSILGPRQLPVYHIHGYLPFGKPDSKASTRHRPSPARLQPTEPLILDRESYERAYRRGSWTRAILDTFLSDYTTLFIGFSFEDRYLLGGLRRISQNPQAPVHFALMRADDERPAGLLGEIAIAGVRPILYGKHNEIPQILGRAYRSVLDPGGVAIPRKGADDKMVSPETVWEMLCMDKQWKDTAQNRRNQKGG